MIKVEVIYEKDNKETIEVYDVATIKQLTYRFRERHIRDNAQMISHKVLYEYEYTIKDAFGNICTDIRAKNSSRAVHIYRRKMPYCRKFIAVPVPLEKGILNEIYKVGEEFNLEYLSNEFPYYLKDIGKWKEIDKGKFKRIS